MCAALQSPATADRQYAQTGASLHTHFHKCPDLYYTAISAQNCEIFGLEAPYVAEMRINDFSDTGVMFGDPETYHRQDLQIMAMGIVVQAQATLLSAEGHWFRMMMSKRRAEDGGIDGTTAFVPLDCLYHGWLERLDRERKVLRLYNGEELALEDLRLLRAILRGFPQKIIAETGGVSVKAIEKRLRRIRDMLHHPHCNCYSVHGCVNWHGLDRMIMDEVDWFDLKPSYQTYSN